MATLAEILADPDNLSTFYRIFKQRGLNAAESWLGAAEPGTSAQTISAMTNLYLQGQRAAGRLDAMGVVPTGFRSELPRNPSIPEAYQYVGVVYYTVAGNKDRFGHAFTIDAGSLDVSEDILNDYRSEIEDAIRQSMAGSPGTAGRAFTLDEFDIRWAYRRT